MRHILSALAGACMLTACVSAGSGPSIVGTTNNQPGTLTLNLPVPPAQIVAQARNTLTAAEVAIAVYTQQHHLAPADQVNLKIATEAAEQLMVNLPLSISVDPATAVGDVQQAINSVISVLPAASLSPKAQEAIMTYQLVTAGIQAFIAAQQAIAAHPLLPTPPSLSPTL
jgi:hypothetical protein